MTNIVARTEDVVDLANAVVDLSDMTRGGTLIDADCKNDDTLHCALARGSHAGNTPMQRPSDLADSTHRTTRPLPGALRLSVSPTLGPYVLPRVLRELQHRHPELRLELIESQTRTLLGERGRGALDVLLLALPLDKPDFEMLPLFEDRSPLAVLVDDPLPERERVSPRDVRARQGRAPAEGPNGPRRGVEGKGK